MKVHKMHDACHLNRNDVNIVGNNAETSKRKMWLIAYCDGT